MSGLEAANQLARNGVLKGNSREHPVIPIRPDEPQVSLLLFTLYSRSIHALFTLYSRFIKALLRLY